MRGVLKKSSQFILVFALTVSWIFSGWPLGLSFAQEATSTPPEQIATTTPEIILEPAIEIATTTATTTEEIIEPTPESPQTGEVLGAITDENGEEPTENEEEEIVEEVPQPIIESPPPRPPLSVRKFERKVAIDRKAMHTCEAETFRIDISGKPSAQARIMFLRDTDAPYEMEIGGLPNGIRVTFAKNSTYRYAQGAGDRYLLLEIRNQAGSQKGDFNIPIIYTKKGNEDISVICQINIVNI